MRVIFGFTSAVAPISPCSRPLLPNSSGPGIDWREGKLCCGRMVGGLAGAPQIARCRTLPGPGAAGVSGETFGPNQDGGEVLVAAVYKYCAF